MFIMKIIIILYWIVLSNAYCAEPYELVDEDQLKLQQQGWQKAFLKDLQVSPIMERYVGYLKIGCFIGGAAIADSIYRLLLQPLITRAADTCLKSIIKKPENPKDLNLRRTTYSKKINILLRSVFDIAGGISAVYLSDRSREYIKKKVEGDFRFFCKDGNFIYVGYPNPYSRKMQISE